MKIAIIPDSFKEGPDAIDIADSLERGIKAITSEHDIIKLPVSDGGDGLANRIINYTSGRFIKTDSVDPLGNKIKTHYGIIDNTDIALIESALTCGINLVPKNLRDPTKTSSYGLGIVLKKVIEEGYKNIIIGLGGSATNDGGIGMLQALDVKLLDLNGKTINRGGIEAKKIEYIDMSSLNAYKDLKIKVACNPSSLLCGSKSTSLIYSFQKGATKEQAYSLDDAMFHFGLQTYKKTGKDIRYMPGSGGAGGIGAALNAYLNAELKHSIEIVKEYLPIEETIKNSDLIISAEGKFDERSIKGKIVGEVGKIAKKYNKAFFVFCGQMPNNIDFSYNLVDGVYCIGNKPCDLEESIQHTLQNIQRTGSNFIKTVQRLIR